MSGERLEKELIDSVVTSEVIQPEEMEDAQDAQIEREERGPGRHTSLKIFFISSHLVPTDIKDALPRIAEKNARAKTFLSNYGLKIEEKENGYYVLTLKWLEYNRDLNFLIKVRGDYWKILTAERMHYVRLSLLRLIDLLEEVDIVWEERKTLDKVVRELIADDSINGFISKRETFASNRRVTIMVYGGTSTDLEKARDSFDSEPTRIYFSKHNSPDAAIVGSVVAYPGFLSIDRILPQSRDEFISIDNKITERFENDYKSRFAGLNDNDMIVLENNDSTYATILPKFRVVSAEFPSRNWSIESILNSIKGLLLEGSRNGESRYLGYRWIGEHSYILHDTEFGGTIQLRVDEKNHRVLLNSIGKSPPKLLADLVELMLERIEPGISIRSFERSGEWA